MKYVFHVGSDFPDIQSIIAPSWVFRIKLIYFDTRMPCLVSLGIPIAFISPAIKDTILRASAENLYWLSYQWAPLPLHNGSYWVVIFNPFRIHSLPLKPQCNLIHWLENLWNISRTGVPWCLNGSGSSTSLWVPKSAYGQVPYLKWLSICISLPYIFLNTLSHL
jgi:hypothetical protein